MVRWQPDSRRRLAEAAMALYGERGYEQTTVAEIAERAGLTERTFFRHFADKREVLFAGGREFQDLIVTTVADAPPTAGPVDAIAAGLQAAARLLEQGRDFSRQRQAIIAANPDLQERELIKLASLSDALADTLRRRGVEDPSAALTAQVGMAVFKSAFERWVDERNAQSFPEVMRDSFEQLKVLAAG